MEFACTSCASVGFLYVLHCSPTIQRHAGLLSALQTLNCSCGCMSMCVSPVTDLQPVHGVPCLWLTLLYCSCDPEEDKWFTQWMNVKVMQSVIENTCFEHLVFMFSTKLYIVCLISDTIFHMLFIDSNFLSYNFLYVFKSYSN